MKKYLTILILFFSFTASAQIIYTPMSAGGYQMKYLKVDSGFALPFRDTTIGRGVDRPGLMVINYADSLPYYYNGRFWKPVYVDSTGVIELINGKVDSVTVNGNNIFYWVAGLGYGAQLNKLDSIHVSADSIFTCIAGNCTFQYLTTAGTGTVTSIMAGFGLTGDTITTTGTIAVDTSVFHTSNWNNAAYAPIVHFHSASDIISGTLPIARGGTGLSGIGGAGQSLRVASSGSALEYYTPPDVSGKVNYTDSGSIYVTPTQLSLSHTDSTAYHTASLNSDSTQLSLTRANGTKDTIPLPFVKKTDTTVINVHYPVWAFSSDSLGLRTDSMPKLEYAIAGRDTSTWDNQTLIDKQFLQDRISAITATGITRTELQDTAAAIRGSIGSGSTNVNIGSGYRLAVPFTNNIKTIFTVSPITTDSVTNSNALTFTFDTTNHHTVAYYNTLYGSLSQQNTNTTAIVGKQNTLTLTTTGTSGAATLSGSTLNIPQYTGGGSTDTTHLSDRINHKQQNLGWVNVMDYGADSTGATDNSAAFASAIATFTGKGGTLFIPMGRYLFTSTLIVNKQIRIIGEGMSKLYGYYPGTQISCATNIDVWKITAAGVSIEGLGFVWTGASNPTSARAVWVYNTDTDVSPNMPDVSQKLTLRDFSVRGFYDNIYVEKCSAWVFDNIENVAPVRYGLHIENTTNQDAGDWAISNSIFFQPMATPGGIAIHQTGSGGGKIVTTKFNGAFNYDIWDSLATSSSILLLSNNSFENFKVGAIKAYSVRFLSISNNEFAAYNAITGNDIYVNACNGGVISANTFTGAGRPTTLAINAISCSSFSLTGNSYYQFTSSFIPYSVTGTQNSYYGTPDFYFDAVTKRLKVNGTIGAPPAYPLDITSSESFQEVARFKSTVGPSALLIESKNGNQSYIYQRDGTGALAGFTGTNGFSIDQFGNTNSVAQFNNDGSVGIGGIITNHTTLAGATLILSSPNNVGIGVSPTAYLHIKAGTSSANSAPFKLTSGTNLTTAEAGAMEYNGTNLFFTPSSAVRNNILMTSSVNTVAPTSPDRTLTVVINGTTYYIPAKTTND